MRISDWSSDVCSSDLALPGHFLLQHPAPVSRNHQRLPMTPSSPQPPAPSPGAQGAPIVLAFSGGLDTSFCVPWLQERGWAVHTVFADNGGVDAEERAAIAARAAELGVARHVTIDGGPAIWAGFVKPFGRAGAG